MRSSGFIESSRSLVTCESHVHWNWSPYPLGSGDWFEHTLAVCVSFPMVVLLFETYFAPSS